MRARRKPDGDAPSAYQQALGLLVRRERSRVELGRKLKERGVAGDEADAALDTLARQDFQNDDRFAGALARTRAAAGYGPVRIRAELATHGLDRGAIAAALDTCEVDWDAIATDAVRRRFGQRLADPAARRKATDLLLRRGFDPRCAAGAVRLAASAVGDPGDDYGGQGALPPRRNAGREVDPAGIQQGGRADPRGPGQHGC